MNDKVRLWGKRVSAVALSIAMVGGSFPTTALAKAPEKNEQGTLLQSDPKTKTDIQIFGLQVQDGGKVYDGNATANVDQSKLEVYTVSPTGEKTKMPASQVEELNLTIIAAFENVSDTPGQRGKDVGENKRVNFEITVGNKNYQLDEQGSQLKTTAKITAKPISVTWSGYEGLTYNGTEQGPSAVLGEGKVEGDTLDVEVGGKETGVGNYEANATLTGDDSGNYTINNSTQAFSIGKLDLSGSNVNVTVDGGPYYWNNDQQITPEESDIKVKVGDNTIPSTDYEIEYGTNTGSGDNAGSVIVKAKSNNCESQKMANFTILKPKSKITVPENFSIEYSGLQPLLDEKHQVSATYGTVKYSVDDGNTWSDKIPEKATVGTYSVQCKVEGGTNYEGVDPSTETTVEVTITQRKLTVKNVGANGKEYDGTKNAELDDSTPELENVVQGDVVSFNKESLKAEFEDENVGQDKTVNFTFKEGVERLTGNKAAQYVVENPPAASKANITPRKTWIGGIKAKDKEYDGKKDATLVTSGATFANLLKGDVLTVDPEKTKGEFVDPNVGENKRVTLNVAFGGEDAGNYELDPQLSQTETKATINKAKATVVLKCNNLTENGSEQVLASATATPSKAKLLWYVGDSEPKDSDWTDKVPTAKAPGKYTVWCKAQGVEPNYNQSDVETGTATINALPATVATSPVITHVQKLGDVTLGANDPYYGTTGEARRMESVTISLVNKPAAGSLEYRSHVQKQGWQQDWTKEGNRSGTTGLARRLEALAIRFTPGSEMDKNYDVYYRMHVQKFGWMGWAKNGQYAGSAGMARRGEAFQIVVQRKGLPAPGATYKGVTQNTAQPYVEM